MRLFVAITVPDKVKEHFLFLQKKIDSDSKINFVKDFHLTLKFLGEVADERVDDIKKQLESVEFDRFTAELAGTGVFPTEEMIRVLWVGVEPADKIIELQKKVDNAIKDFEKDVRFQPHITLGRVKFLKDKKVFLEKFNALHVDPIEFPVQSIQLIKSTLTKQGPVYEALSSKSL